MRTMTPPFESPFRKKPASRQSPEGQPVDGQPVGSFWMRVGRDGVGIGGNSDRSANARNSSVVNIEHMHGNLGDPPVEWPVRIGVLPLPASAFQPRTELRRGLKPLGGTGRRPSAQVLVGDGGVGKTQLAAIHAHEALEAGIDLVLWTSADDTGQIVAAYAAAAHRVRAPGTTGQHPHADAGAFLNWLATTSRRWLVVLDNITDVEAVSGWWPDSSRGTGQVLATTRLRDDPRLTGQSRTVVGVGLYTPAEAMAYLADRLAHDGKAHLLDDHADALAHALGHLPLALGHAAAYMIREKVACAVYLERFTDRAARLDAVLPRWADGDEYGRQVTTALLLALEATDNHPQGPHARAVLQVAAHLHPAGQPAALWSTPQVHAHLARALHPSVEEHASHLLRDHSPAVTQTQVDEALGLLHRYGLIVHDPTSATHTVRIHALTARAERETIPDERLDEVIATASGVLHEAWGDVGLAQRELHSALRANAHELMTIAGDRMWFAGGHSVAFPLGDSLLKSGLLQEGVAFWGDVTATCKRLLGPEDHLTDMARTRLADALWQAGDQHKGFELAFQLTQEFADRYGPKHLDTLSARSEFAGKCLALGQTAAAVQLFEEVATARRELLHPGHPDVVHSRINMAMAYTVAGRVDDGIKMAEPLAEYCRAEFGPDANLTLEAESCLGTAYLTAKRFAEAIPLQRQVAADQERVRGRDHPDTVGALAGLAQSLWETGDRGEAVELLRKVVHSTAQVRGEQHPMTVLYAQVLASWERESRKGLSAFLGRRLSPFHRPKHTPAEEDEG
ncbi:tetratricopeptide repeat protein [Streptomyces sp. NPDC005322]|uniref:tetratricopeptide repeat protein n=1 Tax=Streptomyces sp. NPDC005322 TaxID=3157032 RepID=UPI0033B0599E